jgi:hypothetical protein
LRLEHAANRAPVELAIGLRARGSHGRPLAGIQGAELNAGLIGGARHCPAERVDFLDQVALADAADRGVAAHLSQRLDVVGEQQCASAHTGSRERRFGAGVSAADDDDLVFLRKTHDAESTRFLSRAGTLIPCSKKHQGTIGAPLRTKES